MKDSRGFTLVELLAVIALLGILSGLALQAYSVYQDKTVNQSYDTMSSSAANAAEEYFMDHMTASRVTFADLVEEEYLSETVDPRNKEVKCTGNVSIVPGDNPDDDVAEDGKIAITHLKVELKCSRFKSCFVYPEKKKCTS